MVAGVARADPSETRPRGGWFLRWHRFDTAAILQPLLASEASTARTVSSRRPASSATALRSDRLVTLTMICGSRISTTVPPSEARTTTLQGSNRPM
jgi:hypothetical protein